MNTMQHDPYHLERFVAAQAGTFDQACAELRRGRKSSHWMWFIFPQIAGLGSSPMSRRYALSGLDEARAYLAHPVLGPRLRQVCQLLAEIQDRSMTDVFGYPDDMKLRSSLSLFAEAATGDSLFKTLLSQHFQGRPDPMTLERLSPR